MKISKNKRCFSLSCPKDHTTLKLSVPCSPITDSQITDTKVNTEDTISGFQDFVLRPMIKDRSKTMFSQYKTMSNQRNTMDGQPMLKMYSQVLGIYKQMTLTIHNSAGANNEFLFTRIFIPMTKIIRNYSLFLNMNKTP